MVSESSFILIRIGAVILNFLIHGLVGPDSIKNDYILCRVAKGLMENYLFNYHISLLLSNLQSQSSAVPGNFFTFWIYLFGIYLFGDPNFAE